MQDFFADLRFAARMLRRHRAFSIAAIVILSLGIGATAATFSVVNGVVLQPLPFPNAGRLITLCEMHPGASPDWCSIATPNVRDIARAAQSIETIGVGRTWGYHLATGDQLRSVNAGLVSAQALEALGARPYAGRFFEESDLIGAPSTVAVLSYELWQSQYGADPGMVGRTIALDGANVTVVGIAPPGLELPRFEPVDLWRPLHFRPDDEAVRGWPGFVAYGRLREGVSVDAARAEVSAIASDIRAKHFAALPRWTVNVLSLHDLVVGRVRPVMFVFLAAVMGVLLIACANVANLLLVRANARTREIVVRQALGGGRLRVARGLMVESIVLSLAGAALGIPIAIAGTRALKAMAPSGIPRIDEVHVGATVLLFTLGLAFVTALLFGLAPALRATGTGLSQALREGGRGSTGGVGRLGSALVIAELALAVTLVAGAGLLIRTFAAYSGWEPGFDRRQLVMFNLAAPEERYPGSAQVAMLWQRVEGEIAAIPGVVSVGTASAGPLFGGDGSAPIALDGAPTPPGATAAWFDVSPGWFPTLGLPLVRGRGLEPSDAIGTPRVAVVNERFAQRYWRNEDAVGKRFVMKDRDMPLTVVGVVRDVPPLRPGEPVMPEVYWSNRQLPRGYTYVMVRTSLPPATLAEPIRARLATIDAALEPNAMRAYDDLVAARLKRPRFSMLLLVAFGGVALALAAVGVYGVLAYVVSMREREIGIRIALGARRRQVFGQQLAWGARLAAVGVAIGLVMSFLLGRAMQSQVAGVSSRDPWSLLGSAALLLLVALGACTIPAMRASGTDPARTLLSD